MAVDRRLARRHRAAGPVRPLRHAHRRVRALARQHGFPCRGNREREQDPRLWRGRPAHLRFRLGGRPARLGQGRHLADALPDARHRSRQARAAARHPPLEGLRADSRLAQCLPRSSRHPRCRLRDARERGRGAVDPARPAARADAGRGPLPGGDRHGENGAPGLVAAAGARRLVEAAQERGYGRLKAN
ncbi:hypothetical protein BGLA2_2480024 [Burkholderia gladioli]|nr:hypothetical protein BGLA2_2480024 [Burkholderia gladioli]